MHSALITGISGQDGSLLSELLRAKGYRVAGIELHAPASPPAGVELFIGNVCDRRVVANAVLATRPREIYHLAGQTSVARSLAEPYETYESILLGTLNVLEAARAADFGPRVVVASSGEVFGDTRGVPATETTAFEPCNPYAAAKAAAAHLTRDYRSSFGLFACQAFFYNHESPRRPERFVTRKIARAACRIARGLEQQVELGDLSVIRDWGWAPEYVDALFRMLSLDTPEDFVIATGHSTSLEYFVERAFACVGLDARKYVKKNPAFVRRSEIPSMHADPTRAATRLGWRATVLVDDIIRRLVDAEMQRIDAERGS